MEYRRDQQTGEVFTEWASLFTELTIFPHFLPGKTGGCDPLVPAIIRRNSRVVVEWRNRASVQECTWKNIEA